MSISLKNIHKSFKSHKVLDNVSFDVATGETVVLFGPSGAGKTVLLRLIAGVVDPDEGSIFLNGQDMAGVEAGRSRPRNGIPELCTLSAYGRG